MMEIQAQPWAAVAALLAVTRRQLAVEERMCEGHHLQSECDALVLTLPVESSPQDQRAVRVALYLLHVVWALDRDAWRRVMAEIVGVEMPTRLVLPDAEALTVVVSVKYDKFPWQVNNARWATLLDPTVQLTHDEARVKRALFQLYGHREVCIPAIPLRIQFLVFGMATSVVPTYVTKAVDMVEAVRDRLRDTQTRMSSDSGGNGCAPFVLDSLELSLAPYEMTSAIARQVMRLHALGIRFHQLNLRIIQHEHDDDQQDLADRNRLLSVLSSSPVDISSETDAPSWFVETLVIDRADRVQFTEACTALATTRIVKNLQLQGVFTFDHLAERAFKWEQLARAIFARSSRTSVKHLSISQPEMSLSDVDAVANALSLDIPTATADEHTLATLSLGFEASQADTIEAIPRLLALIGQHLEALSIYFWLGSVPTDLVRGIHDRCPHLLFLDLSSVQLDSMDVFLDMYEHTECRVRSLALHSVEVPNDSVSAFARALGDRRHRASRALRELCVDSVGVDNALDQANLDAFLSLLDAPECPLTYLELHVAEPLLSQNEPRFVEHHDTYGCGVAAPLAISCKVAFLAVCKPSSHRRHSVASQLDQPIISLIFALAATRARKTIHITDA